MNDEILQGIERQLCDAATNAPAALRDKVLAGLRRELRAAAWDARFARTAVALVLVGIGMTAAAGWRGNRNGSEFASPAGLLAANSLAETAATVAEATDAETGRTVARHIALLAGHEWSDEQAAAIDAAILKHKG